MANPWREIIPYAAVLGGICCWLHHLLKNGRISLTDVVPPGSVSAFHGYLAVLTLMWYQSTVKLHRFYYFVHHLLQNGYRPRQWCADVRAVMLWEGNALFQQIQRNLLGLNILLLRSLMKDIYGKKFKENKRKGEKRREGKSYWGEVGEKGVEIGVSVTGHWFIPLSGIDRLAAGPRCKSVRINRLSRGN